MLAGSDISGSVRPQLEFEVLTDLGIFVVYHSGGAPSQPAWEAFIARLRSSGGEMRCLVYTEGWYPTRAQASQITQARRGKQPTIAVLSTATSVQFAVSVFALVNRRMRFFKPEELDQAFVHLGLQPSAGARVREALARLQAKPSSAR